MDNRENLQHAARQFANFLAAGLQDPLILNNNNNNNDQNAANNNGEGAGGNRHFRANHNVEDEDDEDEVEIVDDGPVNNNNNGGIIEGGVAGRPSKKDPLLGEGNDVDTKKKSTECDLVSYLRYYYDPLIFLISMYHIFFCCPLFFFLNKIPHFSIC